MVLSFHRLEITQNEWVEHISSKSNAVKASDLNTK